MSPFLWLLIGFAVLWALVTLFPTQGRQSRNIARNASRPMGSVDRSWTLAGLIIAAVLVALALYVLRASRG